MTDSIYQYVLDSLASAKGNWTEVARATGMSKRTIEKIARQEVKDPGVSHIEKLALYFRGLASKQPARHQSA
jgi:transcriptional regulator with XRE-family HTH domain